MTGTLRAQASWNLKAARIRGSVLDWNFSGKAALFPCGLLCNSFGTIALRGHDNWQKDQTESCCADGDRGRFRPGPKGWGKAGGR
jgi:hypothetical protein